MKTISKLTMLLAFVAFANTLMASGNLKVNITPLTSEKAKVEISNAIASNFQISIENEEGKAIYSNRIGAESNDYSKVFDFSNLEPGKYQLTVSVGGETTARTFGIDKRNIVVGDEKTELEPYFSYKNGLLVFTYLNFSEENFAMNIYDNEGLIYSKKIGKQFNVNKKFDLSKLDKGNYSIELSKNSKSYTYNVDVK